MPAQIMTDWGWSAAMGFRARAEHTSRPTRSVWPNHHSVIQNSILVQSINHLFLRVGQLLAPNSAAVAKDNRVG